MNHQDIAVALRDLYRAGKESLPSHATHAAQFATSLSDAHEIWHGQLAVAGNPEPLVDAVAINALCVNLLRHVVIYLEHGAESLVAAADDFARTDAAAASSSDELKKLVREPLRLPRVPAPVSAGRS